MKNDQEVEWSEADLKYWHILDEDGQVDPGGTREPEKADSEIFAILLQPRIEEIQGPQILVFLERGEKALDKY
jgi:hypothetical protein